MITPTPGQAAYEAVCDASEGAFDLVLETGWHEMTDPERAALEAGAQAAIGWWHADRDLEPPREVTASAPELAAVRTVVAEIIAWLDNPGLLRPSPDNLKAWRERAGLAVTP